MGLLKKIKKGVKGAVKGFVGSGGNPLAALGAGAGAALAGSGSKKAGKEAAKAYEEAASLAAQQYQQVRADAQPYMDSGRNALAARDAMLGLGGADPNASFYESPDYQFRRSEGMRGIERTAAARGGAFSGNALRALTDFNSNLAADEFNARFNRLNSAVAGGQNALGITTGAGLSATGMQGQAVAGAGEARASGIAGQYNALGQGLQDVASIIGEQSQKAPTVPRYPWDERVPVKYDRYGRPNTRVTL